MCVCFSLFFFFFNDTATTEIYTLSLHDALPIFRTTWPASKITGYPISDMIEIEDRKSTRLNSSHGYISYAVFRLKKKKNLRRPKDDESRYLQPDEREAGLGA